MSVNYFDEWGHPITLRDVVDPDEIEGYEAADMPEDHDLTVDSWNPDPWTYDAVVAGLILAFQDENQSVVAPW